MHTSSKILLGLVAILGIAALYFTTGVYGARNEWLKRVEDRQSQVEQLAEELRVLRLAVSDLENEINREMMLWGRSWKLQPNQFGLADPNQGIVDLGLGMNAGLAAREKSQGKPLPTVHLFGLNDDGTSYYLGVFRLTAVEADRARAELVRRPYEGEIQQWQAPAGLRICELVPSQWVALHADLQAQTAQALQAVQDQQARLETQRLLTTKSQEQLDRRMVELLGDPDPVEGAGPDRADGLILSLQKEEAARNQQLAELDRLRHEYHDKYSELIDLIQRNRNMRDDLPQPPAGSENPPVLQVQRTTASR